MSVFREIESFKALAMLQTKALEYANGTRLDVKEKVYKWYADGKDRSWQRVMALIGPAGYGKSVIMAYLGLEGGLVSRKGSKKIVKWFGALKRVLGRKTGKSSPKEVRISLHRRNVTETPNFTVGAAHFFKHDDSNAASVRVCFLSIANQLAVAIPGVKEELLKLDEKEIESMTDLKVLFRSLLCKPMMKVKTPEHPVVVLLDALDDAKAEEKEQLVEILTTLWESETPQWLGVIVSSRPEALVKNKFDNPHMLQLDSEENLEDLSTFLRQRLERLMKAQEDIEKAMKIMVSRCDGLFLFAGFVDTMLQQEKEHSLSLRDIKVLAKEFPPGLENVYRTYFMQFLHGPLENNYDRYQVLLSSMVAARSPLDVDMVPALLELESQDAMEAFSACLEHLLVVEEGRIRFVHESMRDFLQDKKGAGKVPFDESTLGGKHLSVSIDAGHKQLGKLLRANPLCPFALEHLIYHMCMSKDWEGVKERLLDFDWVHAAVSLPGVAKRLIEDTDSLYNNESFADINVTDVVRTIELGRSYIESNPDLLAFHLVGRIADRSHRMLESFHASKFVKDNLATNVYVPIRTSLNSMRSHPSKVLEGHDEPVIAVVMDGDTVVSASRDKTVRLWDRRSGWCLHVLKGHSHEVSAVAIDGDTVVSGSYDTTVRLWDRRSGECLHLLEGHSSPVLAVGICGDTVVSASKNNTVRIWDRWSGEHLDERLRVFKDVFVELPAFAIEGDIVVAGSLNNGVWLWDRRSDERLKFLPSKYFPVLSVAIDGETVVSACNDTVYWIDQQSDKCFHLLEGHSSEVSAVAIDGDTVVSGSYDATVRLWGRRSGECLLKLEGYSDFIGAVAVDGDTFVICDRSNTVRLWENQLLMGHRGTVRAVAVDGSVVVSGSRDNTVRLWDLRSGECLHVLEGHSHSVEAVAINGDTVVSGSLDTSVRLWDSVSGECLQVLLGHTDIVTAVAIDGDIVVSASDDKTVRLWDRQSGKLLDESPSFFGVLSVAISGETLVTSKHKFVDVWWGPEFRDGLKMVHEGTVTTVVVDGNTVVSGSFDKTVRLWDSVSGECLQVLRGHTDTVTAVAIDGDIVVSASDDKTVRLWNRRSGENVQVLENYPADGEDSSIIIATFDGRVSGVALCKMDGELCIVVSELSSYVPHVLRPLSTLLNSWDPS